MDGSDYMKIAITVNGRMNNYIAGKDFNMEDSLSKFLREKLGYTGVRLSCEQGACGACTVLLNGESVLSCMMLAVEADGAEIVTIEGLPDDDPVVEAFVEMNEPDYGTALQCGFCTPGFVLETHSLLNKNPNPDTEEIKDCLSGHICRCGCYKGIGRAVELAIEKKKGVSE
jgi:aerobic-type carbon monoxide dehydrogenase small subunit (CoxS/CutS family)